MSEKNIDKTAAFIRSRLNYLNRKKQEFEFELSDIRKIIIELGGCTKCLGYGHQQGPHRFECILCKGTKLEPIVEEGSVYDDERIKRLNAL
jgi:hypothetical protein